MTNKPKVATIRDFRKGRITDYSVNNFDISQYYPDSVSNSYNVNFDDVIGSGKVRKGITALGTASNYSILGFGEFVGSNGDPNMLLAPFDDGTLYYYKGSNWAASGMSGLSPLNKTHFATLGSRSFFVNGYDAMASSADGINWDATNCISNIAQPNGTISSYSESNNSVTNTCTATKLTQGGDTANSKTYTTDSFTPDAKNLYIAAVFHRTSSGSPGDGSISGCGINWTFKNGGSYLSNERMSIWYGSSSSPVTGALTFTFTGTQTMCEWVVIEVSNIDLSNPFVQVADHLANSTSNSVTLSAFSSTLNPTIGITYTSNSQAISAGGSFTEVGQSGIYENYSTQIEFASSNQTTVNATWSSTAQSDIFGFELKAVGFNQGTGQTFTSLGKVTVDNTELYLKKIGSPTGNATVSIYSTTGTVPNITPDAVLATSDNVDVSTISSIFELVTFTFSGANQITLEQGITYALVFTYTGGDNSKNIAVAANYSYSATSYTQNFVVYNGSWTTNQYAHLCFYLYGTFYIMPSLVYSYQGRLLVSGDANFRDRVYFSSIIDLNLTPSLSWNADPDSGDWIDINPDDGDNITGFSDVANTVLVFKSNYMYRLNTISTSVDPESIYGVGAVSQEAITKCQGMVYFYSGGAVYRTNGGYPVQISRLGVQDFIDAVPQSEWKNVSLGSDEFNVYVSIGRIHMDNHYEHFTLKYSTRDDSWSVHYYPTLFLFFTKYTDSNGRLLRAGGNDGHVYTMNLGNDDNGNAIPYSLETQEIEFGERGDTINIPEHIAVFTNNGENSSMQVKTESYDYQDIDGSFEEDVTIIDTANLQGRYFKFKWAGIAQNIQPEFQGMEFPDVTSLGYIND